MSGLERWRPSGDQGTHGAADSGPALPLDFLLDEMRGSLLPLLVHLEVSASHGEEWPNTLVAEGGHLVAGEAYHRKGFKSECKENCLINRRGRD